MSDDAKLYPNRNALHRQMAPQESCDKCFGRGWFIEATHIEGDDYDQRERYCGCPAGKKRREVDTP